MNPLLLQLFEELAKETQTSGDRCYDFKNIFFCQKSWRKMVVLGSKQSFKLCKTFITTMFFEKNAIFFADKLSKIAETWDYNIDPCS
jgi:hypothetical protein